MKCIKHYIMSMFPKLRDVKELQGIWEFKWKDNYIQINHFKINQNKTCSKKNEIFTCMSSDH